MAKQPNKKLIVVTIALLALLFGHRFIFFSHTRTFVVEHNDAAERCASSSRRRFLIANVPRFRSSVPEAGYLGYCGAIKTDRGYYLLPDEKYPLSLHQPRQNLHQRLKDGCRYKVLIVGYGRKFRVGQRQRVPLLQTISWILEERGCV